jgi:hypothetical protein
MIPIAKKYAIHINAPDMLIITDSIVFRNAIQMKMKARTLPIIKNIFFIFHLTNSSSAEGLAILSKLF